MMTNDDERRHLRFWEMLPWIANGTASDTDVSESQQHLQDCQECRAELARQRSLSAEMNARVRQAPPVERGLENLLRRVDDDMREAEMRHVRAPWNRRVQASAARPRRVGALTYAAAALVLLETGALAVLGMQLHDERPRAAYSTLSQHTALARAATIRLVVDTRMTVGQLQATLVSLHLQIVSGPGENGVYSLAPVSSPGDVVAQVAILRSVPGVRFAEPAS